ncbi:MAG TPA: IS200/IS605 family transposase [Thermoanaerobaculia bacterium]|nr:IS200/IS605 family transposase [Thermoanaerobaculia bacterium]
MRIQQRWRPGGAPESYHHRVSKGVRTMPSTHFSLHYHLVFSTKNRYPYIRTEWIDRLHAFLGGCVKTLGGIPKQVGGTLDHVHLLVDLKATHCLADVLRDIKKPTTDWVRKEIGSIKFTWQEGYGAFTVSASNVAAVRRYIENQAEHHRRRSFQEEYCQILEKHGVAYDERYLW